MEKDLNQQLRDVMADSVERLSKKAVVFQNDIIDKALSGDPGVFDGFGSLIDADIKTRRIEDCNLSVRTTNICKAAGIDRLGDLCKLHKTDWLKFRNGGKRSFIELNDFIKDHDLEWGMNV